MDSQKGVPPPPGQLPDQEVAQGLNMAKGEKIVPTGALSAHDNTNRGHEPLHHHHQPGASAPQHHHLACVACQPSRGQWVQSFGLGLHSG